MIIENNYLSIHQPDFIPYFGFFNKINKSKTFVIMDNVQLSKKGWTHRDKIKTKKGVEWITIPLIKIKNKKLIKDCKIDHSINWGNKHLNLIYENYKNAKFFDEIFNILEKIYENKTDRLLEFNLNSLKILFEILDINTKIILLSELEVEGSKNELLINILKKTKYKTYLSGLGAKNFIDLKKFNNSGFSVVFNSFRHPVYDQLYDNFIIDLSIIDLLFNCGINRTKWFLKNE